VESIISIFQSALKHLLKHVERNHPSPSSVGPMFTKDTGHVDYLVWPMQLAQAQAKSERNNPHCNFELTEAGLVECGPVRHAQNSTALIQT
jgi:hypothetical protein